MDRLVWKAMVTTLIVIVIGLADYGVYLYWPSLFYASWKYIFYGFCGLFLVACIFFFSLFILVSATGEMDEGTLG